MISKPTYFDVDLTHLSENNRKVIELLKEVGELMHRIWLKQVDEKTFESFFYPKDASNEEIEVAAAKNPEIFSAYTVVVRDTKGKLVPIKYTEAYKEEIDSIVDILNSAAVIADPEFSKFLKDCAKDISTNDFDSLMLRYVDTPDGDISVLMGPLETYLDREFGRKKAFQFNMRILRNDLIDGWEEVISLVRSKSLVKPVTSTASVVIPEEIKLSVVDVIMFAGRQASSCPSSTNLPNGDEELKNHGTKIVFYWNSIQKKFDRICNQYLNAIQGESCDDRKEELELAYLRMIALHEISEAIVKFPLCFERLRGYYDAMRELNAFLMSAKNAKYLALNGYLTEKEHKDILLTLGIYGLDAIKRRRENPSIMEYAKGFAVLFNYAMATETIKSDKKSFSLNFHQMKEMPKLTSLVLSIFSEGTAEDAKNLFERYGSFDVFDEVLSKY